jgi:glutamate/tyrosine decarboxylase-like PLP-dependent enzyme
MKAGCPSVHELAFALSKPPPARPDCDRRVFASHYQEVWWSSCLTRAPAAIRYPAPIADCQANFAQIGEQFCQDRLHFRQTTRRARGGPGCDNKRAWLNEQNIDGPDQKAVNALRMHSSSAWFAGPKAENGEAFATVIHEIVEDYYHWRRNYFPEDGMIVDSHMRRENEGFQDEFQDRLNELLGKLKADVPFHSPRYAAHMLSEQTLPSIAGYFATMLYNPNNVTAEVASVTVGLEIEAAQMIARMLGYDDKSWAHLTAGGTIANIEALWIARTVKYLPWVVRDMAREVKIGDPFGEQDLHWIDPQQTLQAFAKVFEAYQSPENAIAAYRRSAYNVVEHGVGRVCALLGSDPVLLISETYHYSFPKLLDVLGLGRDAQVSVRVDSNLRMDVRDLREKLDEVRRAGKDVLALVPVVGTTEEGAVDPVDQIMDLRAERQAKGLGSFWVHADAAWGGYLRTITVPARLGLGAAETEVMVRGKRRKIALELPVRSACDALERLGECDSITIDPHKLGYIPYPAGTICFKSNLVKPLARQDAPYVSDRPAGPELERTSESIGVYILEGSKPGAAAAAVWLSHSLIPLDNTGHGRLIQETVRNASEMYALLKSWPELIGETQAIAVPLCQPGSNMVCYAFRPATTQSSLTRINALNEALYKRFTLDTAGELSVYRQRFFLSRTTLSPKAYSSQTVAPFLKKLGVAAEDYEASGVFLLRSVLMNPWYGHAKAKGQFYISSMVEELYRSAVELVAEFERYRPDSSS